MARTMSYSSRSLAQRRAIPPRFVAAGVGLVLVVASGLLVLAPVLGLVGAAASAGPVLSVPVGSITAVVVLGYLLALGLLVAAAVSRQTLLAWTLAVVAWLVSLAASVWPIIATADQAVDRVRDIWPWIMQLVQQVP
ncbi:hypothetical protein SAMN06264364_107146 [Quadrisphaera granulorum]|uniref:Uncharacterized protein n=1 Tax=Quadrisphaera granulorum TaxID=317664 RepID=A0A316ABP2_9ACTN|nr:hypothetical protein [Quadrisphaera granulorum]PWJ54450.1 hypothetical protein BXY45_107146 [Quadrisphaera granulorum]SZE96222.1 hypothetical protein SAMN06264364_107146 [Quadrisphaera granulorum]